MSKTKKNKKPVQLELPGTAEPANKSSDELATEIKTALTNRLQEVVNIFNRAQTYGFTLGFNIGQGATDTAFGVTQMTVTKSF